MREDSFTTNTTNMAFKIKILQPDTAGKLSIEVTRPKDSRRIGYEIDPINDGPARYFIGFYTDGSSIEDEIEQIETEVEDFPGQEVSTSFTGLVVVGNAVIARDRKRVRNGRVTEQ